MENLEQKGPYLVNKIGDVFCRSANGKEKYLPYHLVVKAETASDSKRERLLRGYAPVKNIEGIEELKEQLATEILKEEEVEAPVEIAEVTNEVTLTKDIKHWTKAVTALKELDPSEREAAIEGETRKSVLKAYNEL